MAPPTVQTLQRLAAETGYRLDTLEKVLRLLELLDEIAQDPVLSQRLALKGGTALNVFYLDLDRVSVDIDLNYVGAMDLAAMERERPKVDAAIDRLFASLGYGVRRRPTGHAGGKWLARYTSALGGNASLELDLNYMARQPLFGAARMESRILGRVETGRVLVLDLHEVVAGKVVALFDRGAARDLFDVRRILADEYRACSTIQPPGLLTGTFRPYHRRRWSLQLVAAPRDLWRNDTTVRDRSMRHAVERIRKRCSLSSRSSAIGSLREGTFGRGCSASLRSDAYHDHSRAVSSATKLSQHQDEQLSTVESSAITRQFHPPTQTTSGRKEPSQRNTRPLPRITTRTDALPFTLYRLHRPSRKHKVGVSVARAASIEPRKPSQ